jgi:hypothetical protein
MSGFAVHGALTIHSRGLTAMKRRTAMRAWYAISMNLTVLVACSGRNDATRGMAPTSRIVFEHQIEARRPETSGGRILHRKGDSVANGDWLQALVTPREDVYLYLGYCDGHEFALFPPQGGLRAEAGHEARIPPGDGGLKISGDSESEVLYLILSKGELSLASPDLAVRIASSGGSIDGDCHGQMRDSAGSSIPPQTPIDVRPSDNAIEVVRYEFQHRASTTAL